MAYSELFEVELPQEPDDKMRQRLRRYLHFKFPTRNAKAFEPDCAAIARVDGSTQLKLLRPSGGKPWRIICQCWRPELMTFKAPAREVAAPPKGASLRVARLKEGQRIESPASPLDSLRQQVLEAVKP